MSYLRSLPDGAALLQVFQTYPDTARPLLDYHELVMRGPSPFSPGERELIAAYVSGVNACAYCHGVHAATAAEFGVPAEVLTAALADLDTAPVDERLARSREDADRRERRFLPDEEKVARADYAYENMGTLTELDRFIGSVMDDLKR